MLNARDLPNTAPPADRVHPITATKIRLAEHLLVRNSSPETFEPDADTAPSYRLHWIEHELQSAAAIVAAMVEQHAIRAADTPDTEALRAALEIAARGK